VSVFDFVFCHVFCIDMNGTVQPNCVDVPLRIYSLSHSLTLGVVNGMRKSLLCTKVLRHAFPTSACFLNRWMDGAVFYVPAKTV